MLYVSGVFYWLCVGETGKFQIREGEPMILRVTIFRVNCMSFGGIQKDVGSKMIFPGLFSCDCVRREIISPVHSWSLRMEFEISLDFTNGFLDSVHTFIS